ncbi:MAG: hypothetical protein K8H90_04360, partial [Thermoanaerobaculia bacterium]|nr:hypothetical protein [Thermoanaerobaculia bacterium]
MRRTPIVAAGVLAALLLVLSPRAAAAQAAFLVEDILPGASSSVASVFAELDGITLFGATDPTNGRELWRSDGTPGGTALLQDLDPGVGSSAPSYFVAAQSDLLFTVSLPSTGNELWILKADPRDFGAAPRSISTPTASPTPAPASTTSTIRSTTRTASSSPLFSSQPLFEGANVLPVAIPADATVGPTFARFRVSSDGALAPGGAADDDGEVEDHAAEILPAII